jgi:hypothetical protein
MSVNHESKQLFIEKCDHSTRGLPPEIQEIIGKLPPGVKVTRIDVDDE